MAKKIIIPEEELHDIADAINNRADYLDDIDEDTANKDRLAQVENENRQMRSADMAPSILSLTVNLRRYYTKDEIDDMLSNDTCRILYVMGQLDEVPEEELDNRTLYLKQYASNRYAIWLWYNGSWQLAGGNVTQEDLNNYYTKAEIDACCNSKQDKLTAGNNISIQKINDSTVISASFSDKFKLKASMDSSSGSITTATLDKFDNPNNDPVFGMLGKSPIYLTIDTNDTGYVVLNIDPDALEGSSNIPLDDSSTKVATTEFVAQKIEEALSGDTSSIVRYVVFENSEEESLVTKETGKIYYNQETNEVHFGDTLLNGLLWNVLDGEDIYSDYVYVLFTSGFAELDDQITGTGISSTNRLPSYVDLFYDPWQGTQTINWNAVNLSDTSKSTIVTNATSVTSILEILGISEYGDDETPVISCSPLPYPLPGNIPNNGFAADPGNYVQSISGTPNNIIDWDYSFDTEMMNINESIDYSAPDIVYPGYNHTDWCTIEGGYPDPESDPADLGYKINPQYIDWSWTGMLYPVWTEIVYTDLQTAFTNHMNPNFALVNTGASKLGLEPLELSNTVRHFRYIVQPIAQKPSSTWNIVSGFESLSDIEEITRENILNECISIIAQTAEDSDFIPFEDSTVIDIPSSSTIFCVYVQEYEGVGEDISIINEDFELFSSVGWGNNTLFWGMTFEKSSDDESGGDEDDESGEDEDDESGED